MLTAVFAPHNRGKVIRIALTVGALFVSTAVLVLLVYRERDVLLDYDWNLRYEYIFAAFGLSLAAMLLPAFVWTSVMRSLGNKLTRVEHFRYYFISHVARRLPGTVWYLIGRNYFYKQHGESMRLVGVASGLEFVIAVSSGAFISLLLAKSMWAQLSQIYLLFLIAALVFGAVATHPRTIQWGLRKMSLELAVRVRYGHIAIWFTIYVVIWFLGGVGLFLIANAVTPVPTSDLPYVIGSWCLVGTLSFLVFFLPSNFGITEVGLSLLLTAIMPSSLAVFVAVFSRLLLMLFEAVAVGLVLVATSAANAEETPHDPTLPEENSTNGVC